MTRIFIYFLLSLLFWINICFYLSFSLSLFRAGYEQDVEFGNTAHLGDCQGIDLISMPCYLSSEIYKHTHAAIHTLYTNSSLHTP